MVHARSENITDLIGLQSVAKEKNFAFESFTIFFSDNIIDEIKNCKNEKIW